MRGVVLIVLCAFAASAVADDTRAPAAVATTARPIVGFRVEGDSKLRQRTLGFLAHLSKGDLVSEANIPQIVAALISSELFKKVAVRLEDVPGGVIVVATLEDKHSWFAAPTLYLLGKRRAFGIGFIENDLAGFNQKLLLYGQIGTHESLFFGTYLDPSVSGTPLTWRFDVYAFHRLIDEYANPAGDPTDDTILRETYVNYIGGGFLIGWTFKWYLVADLRFRTGYTYFTDPHDPNDGTPLLAPQNDGWDTSTIGRLTFDARHYRFGVRWGPYLQLYTETTIPGLDDYDYSSILLRAYYGWRLFEEHQLELRTNLAAGRNLPIQNDLLLGGAVDLRGYTVDRFRGDTRGMWRFEYSVPIVKWRSFAFRAIGFFDSGYMAINHPRKDVLDGGNRSFFYPNMAEGAHWFRTDVGAGVRLYVKSVVLPLLGIDFAYGIEAEHLQMYFQLGLVDF